MNLFYFALAVAILFGVYAQILLKEGASGNTLLAQILAPQSIMGLALYGVAAICYMYALRKIPVSVAFPSVSLICAGVLLVGRQA